MEGIAQKKARLEKTPDASRSDVATQSNNTLDANNYLHYDILRIIFQYLNGRNLYSVGTVCRSWLTAANDEKEMRKGPCCFNISYRKRLKTLRKIRNIPESNVLCHNIENLRIKPLIGFFFISGYTLHYEKEFMCKDLSYCLPKHCEAVMLPNCCILEDAEGRSYSFLRDNIVCACFPQIPDVKMKFFTMKDYILDYKPGDSRMHIRIQDYKQNLAEFQELINTMKYETSRSNYETSTCLMLFHDLTISDYQTRCWARAIKHNKEKIKIVSVCGVLSKDDCIQYKMEKHIEKTDCIALLITGIIQTWSITLDEKCDTKEHIEARLKLFKDKVKLKKYSIGFIFASATRRNPEESEEDCNVVTIFKKLFPKVPLVGCRGQFGKTIEVNERDDVDDEKFDNWYIYEDSTTFLILTYG